MTGLDELIGEYRFVSTKGCTRWRPIPRNGIMRPSRQAKRTLGEHFNLELRNVPIPADLRFELPRSPAQPETKG